MNESELILLAAAIVVSTVVLTLAVIFRFCIVISKGETGEGKSMYLDIKIMLFDGVDTNDIVFHIFKTYGVSNFDAYKCIQKAQEEDKEFFKREEYKFL